MKKSIKLPKQLHPLKAEKVARELYSKMVNGETGFSVYHLNGGHNPRNFVPPVRSAVKNLYGKHIYRLDWGRLQEKDNSRIGLRIIREEAAQKV